MLAASANREKIRARVKASMTLHRLSATLLEVSPGILRLAIEEDEHSRRWVEIQLKDARVAQMPQEIAETRSVRRIITDLAQGLAQPAESSESRLNELWASTEYFLKFAPASLRLLADVASKQLQDRTDRLPSILRVFGGALAAKGRKFFSEDGDHQDAELPVVLLSNILDNPNFFQRVSSAECQEHMQALVGWMTPLLASLASLDHDESGHSQPRSGNDSGTSTPRQRDTPPGAASDFHKIRGGMYAETLKRLINFLLERLQQSHIASRALAIDSGLTLLTQQFEQLNDLASSAMRTIGQVVGLYARTITSFAFQGRLPGSQQIFPHRDPTRQKAQELVLLIFDADQTIVADAVHSLSRVTQTLLSRWRQRRKPGQPDAESIYASARNELYPYPEICTELWSNAYQSFNAAGPLEEVVHTVNIFLRPLANLALISDPQINTHLLASPKVESSNYAPYKHQVKTCLVGISRRLRAMRADSPLLLSELAEADFSSDHHNLAEICVRLSQELIILNFSPISELHNASQNLVRSAHPDVESRADVFKALLSGSTTSLLGLEASLSLFIQACMQLVEANDAAKWIVRSATDILDVLCSRTSGLLRPGAEFSYLDRGHEDLLVIEEVLPRIWELMCRSVAAIFQKTPKWSEHIAKEDMVAWFRDVNIFSSELTEQVSTFQKAANARRRKERKAKTVPSEEEEEVSDFFVSCLALPLEQAMSWLRINDIEIVNETIQFILKTLDCFRDDFDLPSKVKDKMLGFVKEQIEVENANERKTLLSVGELIDLQVRLDPSAKVISISDSEDDEQANKGTAAKVKTDEKSVGSQNWLAAMGSAPALPAKATTTGIGKERQKARKLRQQKLNFGAANAIDLDALDDSPQIKNAQHSSPAIPRDLGSATSSLNKYNPATTSRPATGAKKAIPPRIPNSNMAALRQQFSAAHRLPAGMRKPAYQGASYHLAEMKQARPPGATNTLTGAVSGAPGKARAAAQTKDESDSSSSEDEAEDGPKGLAALEQAAKSPEKRRGKGVSSVPAQPRRTKLLDDGAIDKARKERQEAERKRALRAPTDLRPLHQSILEWDWYHESDTPPTPRSGVAPQYKDVPSTFRHADEYGATFGPMLMLECWAQFKQAKEDFERGVIPMYTCEVQGRVSIDAFVEISAIMTSNTPPSFRLSESDVVIMRGRQSGGTVEKPRMLLAKVEVFKRHGQGSQLSLRCVLDNDQQGISSHLVNRSIWDVGSLFALNTVNREFAALLTLPYYDLVREIMQAKVSSRFRPSSAEVAKLRETYGVNEPQAEAILGSLQGQGFSLVQGPPGTGKTKTICALVAHFVATRKTPQSITAGGRPTGQPIAKKLLMCAPSNAAIDEVARRAKMGMAGPDGRPIKINVVRLGRDDAMNVAVKDISLDNLVEQAMSRSAGRLADGTTVEQLLAEVRSLRDEKDAKQAVLEEARSSGNAAQAKHLEMEIRALTSKRMSASQKLDEARDKRQSAFRQMDADRRRVRNEILLNADIICSTLSGAGHEALASLPIDFETVVIDEAAQAVELSTIIPLRYGCKRCILVGDPNQLPPTVISTKADRLRYSRSLFVRMFEQARDQVYLLSIQYRMHPEISMHPSETFYESKLLDGPNMEQLTARPWHKDHLLTPFQFFSVKGVERSSRGHSYLNSEEAQIAVAIYERLRRAAPDFDFDGKVGCVTMYKGQVMELKRAFANRYGSNIEERIDFNTVDGFQGQEKDVIILSCVRSGKNGLGFLTDRRRINVAITRAKSSMFIVGNAEGLRDGSTPQGLWRHLVDAADSRDALISAHRSIFQAPLGAGQSRRNGAGTERKGGRARTAGWLAVDQQSLPSRNGANTEQPPVKRHRPNDEPATAPKDATSTPTHSPAIPAGLQTMRPGSKISPNHPQISGRPPVPSSLQTRRPEHHAAISSSRPTVTPHGSNAPKGEGQIAKPREDVKGLGRPPISAEARPRSNGVVVRAGHSHPPNGSGALQRPPVRPTGPQVIRPPTGPGQASVRPMQPQPPTGPRIQPRPPMGPSNKGAADGPSQAAMDALFVKKRKR